MIGACRLDLCIVDHLVKSKLFCSMGREVFIQIALLVEIDSQLIGRLMMECAPLMHINLELRGQAGICGEEKCY